MQDLEVNTMTGENETNWTQAVQMAMARITRVTHAQQTENTGRAAEMRRLSRTTEQFALWLADLWDLVGILFIPVHVQVLAAPTHVESLHVMPWWHGFQQAGDGWAEFWVAGLQWEVRHRWAQWEACYGLLVVYRFLDQWTDSWHFWAKTPYKSPFFSMVKLQSGSWETGAWNSALQEMAGGCRKDMSAAYFCCTCQLQSDQAHTFFHTWLWDFVCGIGWQADASGYVSYVASNLLRFSRSIRSRTPRGLRPTLGSSGSILLNHCLRAHLRLEENYNVTGLTCAAPNVVNSIDSKCMQMPTGTGLDYTGRDSQVSGFVSQ